MIHTILIDIDNTLLDFDRCAESSIRRGLSELGIPCPEGMIPTFRRVNDTLWREIEKGNLTRAGLRAIRWPWIFDCFGIRADGEAFEEDYLFGAVTNTVSLGGVLRLDPSRVLLDDGMYELLLVKNPQNPTEAQAMLSALMLQNYDGPLVRMLRASDILFESNHEISWTIDGEFGGSFSTTHILNNKNAVTLMV